MSALIIGNDSANNNALFMTSGLSGSASGQTSVILPPAVDGDVAGTFDSLGTVQNILPDSLSGLSPLGDSLPAVDTVVASQIPDTLTVTAGQMFGEFSYIPQNLVGSGPDNLPLTLFADHLLTDSLVFKLAVLLCFVGYCITLYLYRQQSYLLLGVFRSKLYVDNMLGERNYTFDNFLNSMVVIGVLTLSLAVVKVADIMIGTDIPDMLPGLAVSLLAPLVWTLFGVVFFCQNLLLKAAGTLTYSHKFIVQLRYLRKICFSVFAVLLTPFFLMFSMAAAGNGATILFAIITILVSVMVVFYVARTCMLFVDEKISKLYWFLYLCGVEIFPFTFLLISMRKLLS